ncbi:MAG TPA: hypothetical protein VHO90_08610 [Bacteroidales bacterium]|nr:hypothetical protein [Bacteroidales bacterium]
MCKYLLTFLIATSLFVNANSQTKEVWMFGPMLHFNFGNKEVHTSIGIELSYWNYTHFPYSVDFGIDFERKKSRLYSEVQTGIGILGISAGPVIELNRYEHKLMAGFQGSLWGNYFGGFDLRYRKMGGNSYISPGGYFKLPMGYEGDSDGDSHHFDWDD